MRCVLSREQRGDANPPPPAQWARSGRAHLVLQPVPPAPHVQVPGIGVVEAALTQRAVEPGHSAFLVAHLTHKAQLSAGHLAKDTSLHPPRAWSLPGECPVC